MLNYYDNVLSFIASLLDPKKPSPKQQALRQWVKQLPDKIETGLSIDRYGDLPSWLNALEALPAKDPRFISLSEDIEIGKAEELSSEQQKQLLESLQALTPWRKGPFILFGIHIETEWRSDWKWQRLMPHISSLKDKLVLDVGCGNGYHCLRAIGAGAKRAIGIDPSPRFSVQFLMLKKYLSQYPVDVLPLSLEQLPNNLQSFDTTFSMGVLYHRRSPMDHLLELKETLKPGGQLILETLIIEGGSGHVLVPESRYAMMPNVWFIPSAPTLIAWLKKCGFANPRLVDVNQTSTLEQRTTPWMDFQSLKDYLDPRDHNKTREGYPAPTRGIFIADNA